MPSVYLPLPLSSASTAMRRWSSTTSRTTPCAPRSCALSLPARCKPSRSAGQAWNKKEATMPEVAEGIDPDAPFVTGGRAVIVGASLAGLYAAQALRQYGFAGSLTLVGDEAERPYDRPPLSKAALTGTLPVDHTDLPQLGPVDAEWKL